MDFGKLIRERGELSASQFVSIGVLILALAGVGYYFWSAAKKESLQYPAQVTAASRPGAAILIPFSRKLADKGRTAATVIYGDVKTDPDPLPVGISIIRSGVNFRTDAAVGHMLLWTPADVSGQTHFNVSASDGAALQSQNARITLQVTGAPIAAAEPNLSGNWSDQEQQWQFAADGSKQLTIINGDGRSALDYDLYPDQNGRWFLLEVEAVQPRLYWIDASGDALKISPPGGAFEPVAELRRAGN